MQVGGGAYDSSSAFHSSGFQSSASSGGVVASGAIEAHAGYPGGFSGVAEPETYSSRRENEVEERYVNGVLVSGRKEDREWQDGELLRHDKEHYGEVCIILLENILQIYCISDFML